MLQLLIVSVIWALSFGLTAQVSDLGAPFVTTARAVLAALVFLPFLDVKGLTRAQGLAFLGIGALQFGLMYLFYIASYRWLRPSEVALFTIFTPLLVTLVSDLLDRRVAWLVLLAAGVAVVGTGICVWAAPGSCAASCSCRRPICALPWARCSTGGSPRPRANGIGSSWASCTWGPPQWR